jgi:exonuclease III
MKIATYNVNGIKSRLPNLLAWLDPMRPKCPKRRFTVAYTQEMAV